MCLVLNWWSLAVSRGWSQLVVLPSSPDPCRMDSLSHSFFCEANHFFKQQFWAWHCAKCSHALPFIFTKSCKKYVETRAQICGVTCYKVTQLVWRTRIMPVFLTLLLVPILPQSRTSVPFDTWQMTSVWDAMQKPHKSEHQRAKQPGNIPFLG